jgi:hypothetical protein
LYFVDVSEASPMQKHELKTRCVSKKGTTYDCVIRFTNIYVGGFFLFQGQQTVQEDFFTAASLAHS